MKKMIAAICIPLAIFTSTAFADSTSEYVVEAGAVVISGQAAMDLYLDVDARENVLSSVTRQEEREKRRGSVRCVADFIRGLSDHSDQMGPWALVDAQCSLKISTNVIGSRE